MLRISIEECNKVEDDTTYQDSDKSFREHESFRESYKQQQLRQWLVSSRSPTPNPATSAPKKFPLPSTEDPVQENKSSKSITLSAVTKSKQNEYFIISQSRRNIEETVKRSKASRQRLNHINKLESRTTNQVFQFLNQSRQVTDKSQKLVSSYKRNTRF